MDRPVDEVGSNYLTDICSSDVLSSIICCMDYPRFITFAQVCKRSNNLCENINREFRCDIILQAMQYGNEKFVCRFLKVPHQGTELKLYPGMLLYKYRLSNGNVTTCLLCNNDASDNGAQCFFTDQLILAVENRRPKDVADLVKIYQSTRVISQVFADDFVKACVENNRTDLYLTCVFGSKISIIASEEKFNTFRDVYFPDKGDFQENDLQDDVPEDTLFFDGDSDISIDDQ